jgi:hypothetical protein
MLKCSENCAAGGVTKVCHGGRSKFSNGRSRYSQTPLISNTGIDRVRNRRPLELLDVALKNRRSAEAGAFSEGDLPMPELGEIPRELSL